MSLSKQSLSKCHSRTTLEVLQSMVLQLALVRPFMGYITAVTWADISSKVRTQSGSLYRHMTSHLLNWHFVEGGVNFLLSRWHFVDLDKFIDPRKVLHADINYSDRSIEMVHHYRTEWPLVSSQLTTMYMGCAEIVRLSFFRGLVLFDGPKTKEGHENNDRRII